MGTFGGPDIVDNGLKILVDNQNNKSISNGNFINTIDRSGLGNKSFINGASELTIIVVLEILGNNTSYAFHPVSKWNNGTSNASFVLYHFQNHQGTNSHMTNRLGWYANTGGSWGGIGSTYLTTVGNTYFVGLRYNSTNGGQMWLNNKSHGGRSRSGVLGSGTGGISIDGGISGRSGIHKVKTLKIYDRDLSNNEMEKMYNRFKNRL